MLAELAEFKARDQIAARDLLDATDALRAEMTKGYETDIALFREIKWLTVLNNLDGSSANGCQLVKHGLWSV